MQYITQGVLARTRTTKPSRAHPSHHLLLPEFLKSRYAHPLRGEQDFSNFRRSQKGEKRLHSSLSCAFFNHGVLVELTGIEPVTPCLQSRCSPS